MSRVGRLRRLARLLSGEGRLPSDFDTALAGEEHVLAAAPAHAGSLVATTLGLWVPAVEEGQDGVTHRRLVWHLISHAAWDGSVLSVVEAEVAEAGIAGRDAVVLRDRPQLRFALTTATRLSDVVQRRVTASIRSRQRQELDGGAVWVVQRIVPGTQRVSLQFRPEAGTDEQLVRAFAVRAVSKLATPDDAAPPEASQE